MTRRRLKDGIEYVQPPERIIKKREIGFGEELKKGKKRPVLGPAATKTTFGLLDFFSWCDCLVGGGVLDNYLVINWFFGGCRFRSWGFDLGFVFASDGLYPRVIPRLLK